ncbi:hypothetical protein [Kitasatospora griseola]
MEPLCIEAGGTQFDFLLQEPLSRARGGDSLQKQLLHRIRADDATWARARGWASALSPVFLPHLADNPGMCGTVRSVLGQRAVTGRQDPGTSRRGRASRVDLRKWSR